MGTKHNGQEHMVWSQTTLGMLPAPQCPQVYGMHENNYTGLL